MKVCDAVGNGLLACCVVFAVHAARADGAQASAKNGAVSKPGEAIRVTVENFERAESDMYLARFVNEGGFGKFNHERELASIEHQTVIRLNRDTLYSFGVFDLNAGPVTVTLPEVGKRFMALQVINEDHYTPQVVYAPGSFTFTKEQVGTPLMCLAVRTFVDPGNAADVERVHALQDGISVKQAKAGTFAIPNWDDASRTKIRDALLGLVQANGGLDSTRMFGRKDEVDPVQHLLGTAAGWGGNPRTTAMYVGVSPEKNDGKTPYRLTVKNVPVDGFWSISVYNQAGYFEKNSLNAYTLNNVTSKPDADGSITIQFGGCDGKTPNCLPITPGWNYLVRMYRPRAEILDGRWKFPEAEPMK